MVHGRCLIRVKSRKIDMWTSKRSVCELTGASLPLEAPAGLPSWLGQMAWLIAKALQASVLVDEALKSSHCLLMRRWHVIYSQCTAQ